MHETEQKFEKCILQMCLRIHFFIHLWVGTFNFLKNSLNRCILMCNQFNLAQPCMVPGLSQTYSPLSVVKVIQRLDRVDQSWESKRPKGPGFSLTGNSTSGLLPVDKLASMVFCLCPRTLNCGRDTSPDTWTPKTTLQKNFQDLYNITEKCSVQSLKNFKTFKDPWHRFHGIETLQHKIIKRKNRKVVFDNLA